MPPRTACWNRSRAAPIYGHVPGSHAARGGSVLIPRLDLGQVAVLLEVAQPARRVAVHHELVVVELRVVVRLPVAQRGVDHPQQLVRHGEDRLLVAVVALELRALGARRAVGALGQGRSQGGVARAQSATTLRRYRHCWRSALKAGGGT